VRVFLASADVVEMFLIQESTGFYYRISLSDSVNAKRSLFLLVVGHVDHQNPDRISAGALLCAFDRRLASRETDCDHWRLGVGLLLLSKMVTSLV